MLQWFVDSPLLTIFFCVGVGAVLGSIRFGPVSFGSAGALFVALALSAIEPDVAISPLVTSLALCVFCYMVGVAAGPSFLGALKSGWKIVLVVVTAIVAMAGVALGVGKALGFDIGLIAGAFAGTGSSTPALGAVQQMLAGGGEPPAGPAIGYAVGYPITVLVTILACSYLMSVGRKRPTAEDKEVVHPIIVRTLRMVGNPKMTVRDLSERYDAVISRLTRNGTTVVAGAKESLDDGDLVTVTARADEYERVAEDLGESSDHEPWMDRSDIDFRRITLSNPKYVSRPLSSLGLEERYDAMASRVRRGDVDFIATPEFVLQSGDRIRVTAHRSDLKNIAKDLGDSERAAGDINAIGLGLGLTIGLLLAFVQIPLPGGGTLTLGTATAPLIAGVVLGAIGRTGPVVWTLPPGVSNTLNQFALVVFLVGVGTGAGSGLVTALADEALPLIGLILSITLVHALVCVVGLRSVLGLGTANALGGITGSQLNPAPYAYAMGKVPDQRLAITYAMLFPVSMILKVLVAQLMIVFF